MTRLAIISEHASPLATLGGVDGGGQNVYVAETARHFARTGLHVDVFTRRSDPDSPEIVEWLDGVRVIHVPVGPPSFLPKEQMLPLMGDFAGWVRAFSTQDGLYDLTHANFFMSGLVAADLKRRLGIPFAITFHALGKVRRLHQKSADHFPDERFDIEERLVAAADCILAECPQDERDLIEHYRAEASKIRIVPCGFDPEEMWPVRREDARKRAGLPADGPIVLQLGRMVPRKGVDNVIRAFGIMARTGVDGHLVIVGGEAEDPSRDQSLEMGRLHDVAQHEGVSDRVIFAGSKPREALRDYYSAADVFVTTPWYEPFGITPLEAMACGTPVIGSDVGGVKFSVLDGRTGYLVPSKDPHALAEPMTKVCTDRDLRDSLGEQGLRRVNAEFTWRRVGDALMDVYAEVVSGAMLGASWKDLVLVERGFDDAAETLKRSRTSLAPAVLDAAEELRECFSAGGKVLACGNGGSACDAQHFTTELVGKYCADDCSALPAMALTSDTAMLTAWSNDVGFADAFARQVRAFGSSGDVLVAISTSGRSPNVIEAMRMAQLVGMRTIGLLGGDGGECAQLADVCVKVPSLVTARVQEVHGTVLHMLAELLEEDRAPARALAIEAGAESGANAPQIEMTLDGGARWES